MPLILNLLENEVPLQVICKNVAEISGVSIPSFNGFQIENECITDSHKNRFQRV